MTWKATAVKIFPSNCEWQLMLALRSGPLTVAQLAQEGTVETSSVPATVTRCQHKGLVRRVKLIDGPAGRKANTFGLTAYGEQLVEVTFKFGRRRRNVSE